MEEQRERSRAAGKGSAGSALSFEAEATAHLGSSGVPRTDDSPKCVPCHTESPFLFKHLIGLSGGSALAQLARALLDLRSASRPRRPHTWAAAACHAQMTPPSACLATQSLTDPFKVAHLAYQRSLYLYSALRLRRPHTWAAAACHAQMTLQSACFATHSLPDPSRVSLACQVGARSRSRQGLCRVCAQLRG